MIFPRFVIPKRFERLTHALEGRCSIQLSYGTSLVEWSPISVCKDSAFIWLYQVISCFFIKEALSLLLVIVRRNRILR